MTEDLYGLKVGDLQAAKESLLKAVCADFELHESSFHGGDYYRVSLGGGTGVLQMNYDSFEEEYAEEKHSGYPVIFLLTCVSVEEADGHKASLLRFSDINHLRRL